MLTQKKIGTLTSLSLFCADNGFSFKIIHKPNRAIIAPCPKSETTQSTLSGQKVKNSILHSLPPNITANKNGKVIIVYGAGFISR